MCAFRWIFGFTSLVCILVLSACEPEKTRIRWSPDGSQALVVLPDGLHLCDPEGQLSPLLVAGANSAEWLADSRRLVVLRTEPLTSWAQVSKLIAEPTRRKIIDLATQVRTAAMSYQGDWEQFGDTLKDKIDEQTLGAYFTSIALYLHDQDDAALRAKLGAQWEKAIGAARVDSDVLQTYEINQAAAKPGPVLLQWAVERSAKLLRVSPTGQYVAVSYLATAYAIDHPVPYPACGLGVVALDGSESFRPVSELTTMFVDWTPDGRYLVFGRTDYSDQEKQAGHDNHEDRARLVAITKHKITDLEGTPPENIQNEDLAGVLYSPALRVRCLKDGRILFSTSEMHLPATPNKMPKEQSIFALDPAKPETVTNLIPPKALASTGGLADYFELSPDAKSVSLLSPQGHVLILTLATGEVTACQKDTIQVQTDNGDLNPRIVPQWRTSNQLTYVRLVENPKPGQPVAEVVLRNATTGDCKSLSAKWPAASVRGFLIAPPPAATAAATATAPATQQ